MRDEQADVCRCAVCGLNPSEPARPAPSASVRFPRAAWDRAFSLETAAPETEIQIQDALGRIDQAFANRA